MITIQEGNIFDFGGANRVLIHGCNCQSVMGSGVAKQVKDNYPAAYNTYLNFNGYDYCVDGFIFQYPYSYKGKGYILTENERLGKINLWNNVLRKDNEFRYIVNAHTQLNYGSDGKKYTSYEALLSCLEDLYKFCLYKKEGYQNLTVVMPYKMASDRGGADWEAVYALVKAVFKDIDVIIVKYKP